MAVEGLGLVLRNLNREIAKIEGGTSKGLYMAGLDIQAKAMEITPWEFGNLVSTAFTNPAIELTNHAIVSIGYTAPYAPYVHEMPPSYNFTKPQTGPKFLQKAISRGRREILDKIKEFAEIKGGSSA